MMTLKVSSRKPHLSVCLRYQVLRVRDLPRRWTIFELPLLRLKQCLSATYFKLPTNEVFYFLSAQVRACCMGRTLDQIPYGPNVVKAVSELVHLLCAQLLSRQVRETEMC